MKRSYQSYQLQLSSSLVISVGCFVSCRFTLLFIPEMNAGRRHHNFYMTCVWLIVILTYVNATFNILLYYNMGSRYRKTFWAMFSKKSTKSKSNETSGIVTSLSIVP